MPCQKNERESEERTQIEQSERLNSEKKHRTKNETKMTPAQKHVCANRQKKNTGCSGFSHIFLTFEDVPLRVSLCVQLYLLVVWAAKIVFSLVCYLFHFVCSSRESIYSFITNEFFSSLSLSLLHSPSLAFRLIIYYLFGILCRREPEVKFLHTFFWAVFCCCCCAVRCVVFIRNIHLRAKIELSKYGNGF